MRNDGGRTSIFAELNEIEREQFARCYINDLVFDLSVFVNGICVSLALSSSFSLSHSLCVCVCFGFFAVCHQSSWKRNGKSYT